MSLALKKQYNFGGHLMSSSECKKGPCPVETIQNVKLQVQHIAVMMEVYKCQIQHSSDANGKTDELPEALRTRANGLS
jgi:hypothetical protein